MWSFLACHCGVLGSDIVMSMPRFVDATRKFCDMKLDGCAWCHCDVPLFNSVKFCSSSVRRFAKCHWTVLFMSRQSFVHATSKVLLLNFPKSWFLAMKWPRSFVSRCAHHLCYGVLHFSARGSLQRCKPFSCMSKNVAFQKWFFSDMIVCLIAMFCYFCESG